MSKFTQCLKNAKKILVISSQPLDPDCIASGVVMRKYLEELGYDPTLRFPKELTPLEKETFSFLPFFEEFIGEDTREYINNNEYDTIILLDGSSFLQFYDVDNKEMGTPNFNDIKTTILIDHHPTEFEGNAKLEIRDDNLSSTTEVMYSKILPKTFVKNEIATLLYIGIMGDTNNFSYAFNATTLKHAAELIERGAQPQEAINNLYNQKTKEYLSEYTEVINKLEFNDSTKTIFFILDAKDASDDKVKMAKKLFRNEIAPKVKGYDRGINIQEIDDNTVRIITRGNAYTNKISLPDLLKTIGGNGGGHFNAASTQINGNVYEIQKILKENIRKFMQSPRP